jgi:hypothetical protein
MLLCLTLARFRRMFVRKQIDSGSKTIKMGVVCHAINGPPGLSMATVDDPPAIGVRGWVSGIHDYQG